MFFPVELTTVANTKSKESMESYRAWGEGVRRRGVSQVMQGLHESD